MSYKHLYEHLHLTDHDIETIFAELEKNPNLQAHELQQITGRDPKTARRMLRTANKVLDWRREQPPPDHQFGEMAAAIRYGVSAEYVRHFFQVHGTRQARLRRPQSAHLDDLYGQLGKLKACFENVDSPYLPPDYRELLEVRGCDWRLDPMMWFYMCTPDLSDMRRWDPEFKQLLEHMEGGEFKKRFGKLRDTVQELEKTLVRLVQATKDTELQEKFKAIQVGWLLRRKPDTPKPHRVGSSSEPEDLEPDYTPTFAEQVMAKLEAVPLDIWRVCGMIEKQLALEEQLQALQTYLSSDEIRQVIKRGKCSGCAS